MMMMNGEESASQTMDLIKAKLEWCMTRLEKMTLHSSSNNFRKNQSPKSVHSQYQCRDYMEEARTAMRISTRDEKSNELRIGENSSANLQDCDDRSKSKLHIDSLMPVTGKLTSKVSDSGPRRSVGDPRAQSGSKSLQFLESPETQFQVLLNLEQNHGDSQLGYRSGDVLSVVDNHDSILQDSVMPMFEGTHPKVWISRMEKFFSFMNCAAADKMTLVSFCLEGDALRWFRRERHILTLMDWNEFQCRLLTKFGAESLKNEAISVTDHVQEVYEVATDLQEEEVVKTELIHAIVPQTEVLLANDSVAAIVHEATRGSEISEIDWVEKAKRFLEHDTSQQSLDQFDHITSFTVAVNLKHEKGIVKQTSPNVETVYVLSDEVELFVASLEQESQATKVSPTKGNNSVIFDDSMSSVLQSYPYSTLGSFEEQHLRLDGIMAGMNDAQKAEKYQLFTDLLQPCYVHRGVIAKARRVNRKHQRSRFFRAWKYKYKSPTLQFTLMKRLLWRYTSSFMISQKGIAVVVWWCPWNRRHCSKRMKRPVMVHMMFRVGNNRVDGALNARETLQVLLKFIFGEVTFQVKHRWKSKQFRLVSDLVLFVNPIVGGNHSEVYICGRRLLSFVVKSIWVLNLERICYTKDIFVRVVRRMICKWPARLYNHRPKHSCGEVTLQSTSPGEAIVQIRSNKEMRRFLGSSLFSREEVYYNIILTYTEQRDKTEQKWHEHTIMAHSKFDKQQSVRWLLFHKQSRVHSVLSVSVFQTIPHTTSQSDDLDQDGAENVVWLVLQNRDSEVMLNMGTRVFGMCYWWGIMPWKIESDASSRMEFVLEITQDHTIQNCGEVNTWLLQHSLGIPQLIPDMMFSRGLKGILQLKKSKFPKSRKFKYKTRNVHWIHCFWSYIK